MPIWAPLMLGYWAAGGRGLDIEFALLLALGIFLGGGIYGLNQIYDVEGDRLNKKNLPLSLGLISESAAWVITAICFIGAIVTGGILGLFPGILTAVGAAMGILYSHPRWKLKDKPIWGLVLNGIGHGGLVYLIGWSSAANLQWFTLLRALPYIVAYAGVYLATTIPDASGDKIVGKRTLTVILGRKTAVMLAFGLIVIASAISLPLKEPAVFLTGLFSAPFYIYAAVKGAEKFVTANKAAVFFLNLWVCVYIFFYIIPLVAVIVLSRLYFTSRFDTRYP